MVRLNYTRLGGTVKQRDRVVVAAYRRNNDELSVLLNGGLCLFVQLLTLLPPQIGQWSVSDWWVSTFILCGHGLRLTIVFIVNANVTLATVLS
jgi:hypothetical protein